MKSWKIVFRKRAVRQTPGISGRSEPGGRQAGSLARRRRILEAARACFGEAGFAGATVSTIAARAGVSNGLLYQFFRSKEHLFEVVLREILRDWVRAMLPREAEGETPSQALEGM